MQHLKKFPHIVRNIEKMWGSQNCRNYILELLNDTRGGTRKGFALEQVNELMEVLDKHDEEHPQFVDDSPIDAFTVTRKSVTVRVPKPDVDYRIKAIVAVGVVYGYAKLVQYLYANVPTAWLVQYLEMAESFLQQLQ